MPAVAIAGAGPAGLTLALALAQCGVRSTVVEQRDAVAEGSRALGLTRRTLDIWDRLGIGTAVRATGLPWYGGRSYYREREILAYEIPHDPALKHAPMTNLQQDLAEQLLVDAATASPLIDLRWETHVEDVSQDAERVTLTLAGPNGSNRLETPYLVACDGARSTVRTKLELPLEGTTHDALYVIVDIKLDTQRKVERNAWFDPRSNPGSTVLMHGQPHGIWRIDYQLTGGASLDEALEPENVAAFVRRHLAMIGETGDWKIVWISSYRAHSLTMRSYRDGRVFFAGDAAHLMPIFGIRGLNSGIEDAWNLAWKLSAVLAGSAADRLLDSYNTERHAAAQLNLAEATRAGRFMSPPTRGFRRIRDAVLSLALSEPAVRDIINPRQGSLIALADSPLSTFNEQPASGSAPAPGDIMPNLRVRPAGARDDAFLYDLLTYEVTMVSVAGDLPEQLAVASIVLEPSAPGDRLALAPGTVYVLRADNHVAARFNGFRPADVQYAIDVAAGRRTPARALPVAG